MLWEKKLELREARLDERELEILKREIEVKRQQAKKAEKRDARRYYKMRKGRH
jgi:hypothetical protein